VEGVRDRRPWPADRRRRRTEAARSLSQPRWTPQQVALVGRLRSLIARFEETRELRLMGGYTPGGDPVLDQAVKTVPRIYEAMMQSLSRPAVSTPSSTWPRPFAPDPNPGKASMRRRREARGAATL